MNIRLLGTAASEGFPAMFCACDHCMEARRRGGKNIRSRTSALIDDIVKIDFPADTLYHVIRDQLRLDRLEELWITHTHQDHLVPTELTFRQPVYAHGPAQPLHVYGHDSPIRMCRNALGGGNKHFIFQLIQPFRTVTTKNVVVTPLLADHDPNETCLLFYIERNGKSLLYGHDTGWFPDETWAWLEGKTVDAAIMDCTNGRIPSRRNHMNIEAVIEIRDRFVRQGVFHANSVMVATHFSHNIGLLHEDLERIFAPEGILVAYDGMVLDI